MVGDCHDPRGAMGMCVAGAIRNFTMQLLHFREGTSDRRCKEVAVAQDAYWQSNLHALHLFLVSLT